MSVMSRNAKTMSLIFLASASLFFALGVITYGQLYKVAGMIYFGIGCILLGVGVYKSLGIFHSSISFFFAFIFI